MLNTANPNYRAALPHIKSIRKSIGHFCGSLNPVGHYTEPRVYGAMTKYWEPTQISAYTLKQISAIVRVFNKTNPGWTATVKYGESNSTYMRTVNQLVIHVNKNK